jgi:hypothetical protein
MIDQSESQKKPIDTDASGVGNQLNDSCDRASGKRKHSDSDGSTFELRRSGRLAERAKQQRYLL